MYEYCMKELKYIIKKRLPVALDVGKMISLIKFLTWPVVDFKTWVMKV